MSARSYDTSSEGIEWTFMTTRCWDESPIGTWKILAYYAGTTSGSAYLSSWGITIYGTAAAKVPCTKKQYEDADGVCQPCDTQCGSKGCSGPGPAACLTCANVSINGTCVAECPPAYYVAVHDNGASGTCEPCHKECAGGCEGPGAADCADCAHFTWINKDADPECLAECQPHQYADTRGYCQACHDQCVGGCHGAGPTNCTDCLHIKLESNDSKSFTCVSSCPGTHVFDSTLQRCVCIKGFYEDRFGVCQECNEECDSMGCTGPEPNHCIGECLHLQYRDDCVAACPALTIASNSTAYVSVTISMNSHFQCFIAL